MRGMKRKLTKRSQVAKMFTAIPDLVFVLHHDGTLLDVKEAKGISLLSKDSIGCKIQQIITHDVAQLLLSFANKALMTGEEQLFEFTVQIDGKTSFQESRMIGCDCNEVVAIVRDITDNKKLNEQLIYLSWHDSLTGCYNKAYFEEQIKKLEKNFQLNPGIIVCDFDGLKAVNDSLGHDFGDQVIIQTASILKSCFRENDIVARIGGDEFAILMLNVDELIIKKACNRIQDACILYNKNNPNFLISISYGCAVRINQKSMQNVFKEADQNMYNQKFAKKWRKANVEAFWQNRSASLMNQLVSPIPTLT